MRCLCVAITFEVGMPTVRRFQVTINKPNNQLFGGYIKTCPCNRAHSVFGVLECSSQIFLLAVVFNKFHNVFKLLLCCVS